MLSAVIESVVLAQRKGLKIVSYAADSILQVIGAEVNKQAEAKILKFELGKKLLPVNRKHHFNRLQLYDALFDDEISPTTLFKFDSVVLDWDRHLPCYFEMLFLKFVGQDHFVDVFKAQARIERERRNPKSLSTKHHGS